MKDVDIGTNQILFCPISKHQIIIFLFPKVNHKEDSNKHTREVEG